MFPRLRVRVKSTKVVILGLCALIFLLTCALQWKQKSVANIIRARCIEAVSDPSLSTNPHYRISTKYSEFFFNSFMNASSNECNLFRNFLGLRNLPVTPEERQFPLAFAIAVYKDISQVARLLRLIYRPHNFYVFHVDKNSKEAFFKAVNGLPACFGKNVAVIPRNKSVCVKWCSYTVLELELIMMRKLLSMGKWKYFINLTGQELPLKTNLEMVRALTALNGSNLVEGTVKHRNPDRIPKVNLSFPVTWVKGGVHMALLREFVEFSLFDRQSTQILAVLRKNSYNKCPDEQFFATLTFNPQLGSPGACLKVYEIDEPDTDPNRLHFMVREKLWYGRNCSTKIVRGICIFGTPNLLNLLKSKALAANKFHADYYPVAYDCLEYALIERAKRQETGNAAVFKNRYCSRKHI